MRPTTNPVLIALAQARMRAAPMFVKWCELNGLAPCPAAPADVARFVTDCASIGIERLWPAIQEISRLHASIGLADPTLGAVVAATVNDVARISPPRSWPADHRERFRSLPYDLQVYVAAHELQRERALRRAQNDAALLRRQVTLSRERKGQANEQGESDEDHSCGAARSAHKADPSGHRCNHRCAGKSCRQ